jgi:hypothetical protein
MSILGGFVISGIIYIGGFQNFDDAALNMPS